MSLNELVLDWSKLIVAGIGTLLSGTLLFLVQRYISRKDAQSKFVDNRKEEEEERHKDAHKRYERNFIRIAAHPDFRGEIEVEK